MSKEINSDWKCIVALAQKEPGRAEFSGVAKYICHKSLTEIEKRLLLFCFLPVSDRGQGFSQFDPEASFDSLLLLF